MLGLTYNPIKRELCWAARGAGCYLDDCPVHVTAAAGLTGSVVLASRSETARGEWAAYKDQIVAHPIGSVAYKLALVAAGKADGTFTASPKSEWDIASGVVLVIAAGGRVTDLHGGEVTFNRREVKTPGFVASNGHLHAEIERMLPRSDRMK